MRTLTCLFLSSIDTSVLNLCCKFLLHIYSVTGYYLIIWHPSLSKQAMHLLLHKQKVSDCASLAKVQCTSSTHVFCAHDEDHAILELPASCHKVYCIVVDYTVSMQHRVWYCTVCIHSILLQTILENCTTMNSAMALTYTHILLLLF